MSRFSAVLESQVAQLSGAPVTTTVNGYVGALVGGASANFKLRRAKVGMRAGVGAITGQQITLAMFRQSVRASGTGVANAVGQALDPRGAASAIGGLDSTTATTIGTTGPTLSANKIDEFSFNTQVGLDLPWEFQEEFICDQGTANGLAFVIIGNALPASSLLTLALEWEE